MSANANTTVVWPGTDWNLQWSSDTFVSLQLDIVGFLAVLGEGSVLANAQVSALSGLFYLPRLIPAPQALLRPARPVSLPTTAGSVTAVYSGNVRDHVNHVASILLGGELPLFQVRCVEVKKKRSLHTLTWTDTFRRRRGEDTHTPQKVSSLIQAKATGPLAWVTLIGFSFSLILFVVSWVFGDGMSMIATVLLSLLSTLIGFVNGWTLELPKRPPGAVPPLGDVVIRYPNGSYLVVRCEEDIARELFFAPEEIDYNIESPVTYRLLSLVGTVMLMCGVVALANAKLQLQFAWAGAYILINVAHWLAAAVPPGMHWDLSCYELKEECLSTGPTAPSFTEALWRAIVLTRSIRWVLNGKAAPQTETWDQWLRYAESKAQEVRSHMGVPRWTEKVQPFWSGDNPNKAIIWDVPEWNAKLEWNRLNDEFDEAKKTGVQHPTVAA